MKRFLCICLGLTALAHAKTPPPPPPCPPAWDADLFRKNVQVVSGHLEFLYWKPEESALDYALKMSIPAGSIDPSFAQGTYKSGSFNMTPGVRLSISYFRAPKEWEVWGSYTRLTSTGHNSTSKPTPATVFLTGTWPQIMSSPLTQATSSLHLNYNVADLLADRYFNPNAHFRLRLLGGLTSAWMDQYWAVQYFDAPGDTTRIVNTWGYAGGGFRFGAMIDWFWTHDIYFTARGTFAALMGCYKNQSKQTTNLQSTPVRNAIYRDTRGALSMQAMLGPSWQKNYSCMRVEVFAGYEITTWSNLQEIYHSTAGTASAAKETWTNTGLLSMQGLTARVTMDF